MEWTKIFKRKNTIPIMPEPNFKDNWLQERYEKNVKQGVAILQKGQEIRIIDDGRGYELALEIKRQFMLEYQKRLSAKIKISGGKTITVAFSNEP